MDANSKISESSAAPSAWVKRFLPLITPSGLVLDLAAGGGRHSRLLRDSGFRVCAVDRDVSALLPLADGRCEVRQIELQVDAPCRSVTGTTGSS